MKTRSIKQTETFRATPHEIYAALLDARLHAAFTRGAAKISPTVGSSFETYDGYINGKNLQLKEDKKIVQAWRADEERWPKDHFSNLTITLKPVRTGTELHLAQTGIPEEYAQSIADGWVEFYWSPLRRMLETGGRKKPGIKKP